MQETRWREDRKNNSGREGENTDSRGMWANDTLYCCSTEINQINKTSKQIDKWGVAEGSLWSKGAKEGRKKKDERANLLDIRTSIHGIILGEGRTMYRSRVDGNWARQEWKEVRLTYHIWFVNLSLYKNVFTPSSVSVWDFCLVFFLGRDIRERVKKKAWESNKNRHNHTNKTKQNKWQTAELSFWPFRRFVAPLLGSWSHNHRPQDAVDTCAVMKTSGHEPICSNRLLSSFVALIGRTSSFAPCYTSLACLLRTTAPCTLSNKTQRRNKQNEVCVNTSTGHNCFGDLDSSLAPVGRFCLFFVWLFVLFVSKN